MKSILIVYILFFVALSFSQNQTRILEDAQSAYIKADKELNEVYQKILLTHTNAKFIKNLRTAQRQWIKFRDAQFEMTFPESKSPDYMSTLTAAQAVYLTRLTKERTKVLQELLDSSSCRLNETAFSATGGTITYAGGKIIHTFTSSGTFSCSGTANVEVLVVAGGGGGGCHTGGGGGAGGVVYYASYPVSGDIHVIVGTGGNGSNSSKVPGSNGSNSAFDTIVAIGGGGGASRFTSGGNGGSGGGGSPQNDGISYGRGTSGQGCDGGVGGRSWNYLGGGGGGAGSSGSGGTGSNGNGNGGAGIAYSISGYSVYYGGGGGGGVYSNDMPGAGGIGGGGAGSNSNSLAVSGAPNTGGGGGGGGLILGYASLPGGNGGSGIVIVSYTTR